MITLDTNVYVSALIFGGKPATLLMKAIEGEIEVAISEPILAETLRVLRDKFGYSPEQLRETEERIRSFTRMVTPRQKLAAITEDPDDDKILECAVASRSEMIVSGDRDLLRREIFQGIRIVPPSDLVSA